MYTKEDIFAQLCAMNAPRDSVVLMHTALRLIGDVEGGASGLLDILLEYFTAEGGLFALPTHTWNNLGRTDVFTLDMTKCESNLSAFARVALADGRGVRSEHPSHSVVVFGDKARARAMVEGDMYLTTPAPGNSFYGRLYDAGGYVLLAGTSQTSNTFLHTVDEILDTPDRMGTKKYPVSVKRENGEEYRTEIVIYKGKDIGDVSQRFCKFDLPFRYHGAVTGGFLGDAPAMLCSARGMFDVMKLIYERGGASYDPLVGELAIPPKYYVK